MSSKSGFRKNQSPEPEPSRIPRHDSTTSSFITLTDSIPTVRVCDSDPGREHRREEALEPGIQPQDGPSLSDSAIHVEENEEMIITSVRATSVVLGLRRLPAGFYTEVHHSGLEWRTENKASLVNHDVVEWNGPIPIPSDPSAIVRIEVYASFEFQPMLGAGEQLRKLETTVEQLLDYSARDVPFAFFPIDGDVVSPCSSILVTVKRQECESSGSSPSGVLAPCYLTTESQGELAEATSQGHSALFHYRNHGEKQDLERSIAEYVRALNVCPLNHPCRAVAQSNLAMATFILCQVEGTDALLPMELYRDALRTRPVGHIDRPSTLIQLAAVHFEMLKDEAERGRAEELLHEAIKLSFAGSHENRAATLMLRLHARRSMSSVQSDWQSQAGQDLPSRSMDEDLHRLSDRLLARFERLGDLADLQEAVKISKELVRSTSVLDDRCGAGLGNLGMALLYRFKHLGELSDLENAISTLRRAVDLTAHGHPDRPDLLNSLGTSFRTRFEHLGELGDLENAISTLKDAVDLTPRGHPDSPGRLSSLGISFGIRYQRLGELSDIENAISMLRHAVELTPRGHPARPSRLNNLGNSLFIRFKHLGELGDLENIISTLREAIDLTPRHHPHKPSHLSNLSNSFSIRFERLGELSDLESAISTLRGAVDLTPLGHPDKPARLSNLGTSFKTRFERLGELGDIENAISMLRDAVDLTPCGHPDRAPRLNNLGNSFRTRFEHFGELSDLENAISMLRDAVNLTPHGHLDKPSYLSNLGTSFSARFERLGDLSDAENAISTLRNAIDLTPHGHPDKHRCLYSPGTSFYIRFERLGELSDLENAVSILRDAVDLTPHSHPYKPRRLSNLGSTFRTHFECLGELGDLDIAIALLTDAVELAPHDHPDRPSCLSNLGASFFTRFERVGELSDLEIAISTLRDAVDLTRQGHPEKLVHLNNLGTTFRTRFDRLGELSDAENAISTLRDAIALTPYDHPYKPGLFNNLGISFFTRFKRLGEMTDLEDAISTLREAVDLTPHGHPDQHIYLNNLGTSFRTRFERLRELSDLENAILMLWDAVNLTPHGRPDKPSRHSNLGTSFFTRFECLGEPSDLENAVSTFRDAVYLTPHGHPDKPARLTNLGTSFRTRFKRLGELSDLERAISIYYHAASSPFGSIQVRFDASQQWISCARLIRHHSLLHAYSVAMDLLPQLAWIGLSLTHRYSELMRGADVARDAAAAALHSGFPETAVEWLERGRSIVWGELFQLRSSYEELLSAHPDHARRLRELSAALDHASASREKSLSALSEDTQREPESLQQEADRHRMLAIKRDKLLREIRRLPDFERFLLQKEFSRLRTSARAGPVVILNAAGTRCDALIVLANVDRVIHLPLPDFTLERSTHLQNTLKGFVRHVREGKSVPEDGFSWESILSPLWKCVVKPVLDALAFSTHGDPLRIFWCPTGPFAFLPIHAAGFYDAGHSQLGHKVFDFVVSSYVPSLSILTPPPVPVPTGNLRFLVVRQPSSDGLSPLPGVVTELKRIREVVGSSPSACTTIVESSVGTVDEVLSLMKEADWVHFACHGIQDPVDPTNSGLCLADGRCLTLHDIVALSNPRRGLAFLSACQTAMGYERLSDEAIHITAGMLLAGYGGAIGTMWSISDRLAPNVARHVYEHLFRNGTRPDYLEAARALHEAIEHIRDGDAPFDEWIPFIHVGL